LTEIARKHPAVLGDPVPLAVFDRFGDSALNFALLCWCVVDTFFITRSELTIAINTAFKQAGIEIPFPQQDVHVYWPDGAHAAGKQTEVLKDTAQGKSAKIPTL
jgi:potassium efflux system protein